MNDHVVHIRPRKAEPLKVGDKVFQSAYDWELTEKDLKTAAHELGETEEKKKACLRKLKEKLSKASNVKYRQDDFYLLRFLRVRKYDVKKAYHNMELFFEHRKKLSDYFTLPQELKSSVELNFATVLPYTNEEGLIMFLLNLSKWDPADRTFKEFLQPVIAVCDIVSMNPHCQINGVIGLWNLNGISMRHASALLWNGQWREIISIFQNGYPWRIKKIILFNANQVVRLLYNMARPFLQRKIAERISVNAVPKTILSRAKFGTGIIGGPGILLLGSDVTELHQHVNPALLPESLQGSLKEETCDISQHVMDNLPYLKYERTFIFQ